jgi:hypothetical protein
VLDADIEFREKTVDKPDSGLRPIKQFRAFHASFAGDLNVMTKSWPSDSKSAATREPILKLDFIGFSKPVLETAFARTYSLDVSSIFVRVHLSMRSYRYAVSTVIPRMFSG